ncbi:TRAP transporter small permease [Nitratireductor mangrovi]|uniref:TRAP transporter small permease protein n=1 Tax=Nitratireductor mangrovi TaxID=2599600 RepID=A0A5B8KVM3_9HYPH|nr:TRAP transporter small permease [Nitratireductor mangrovi]QDY99703.1 TRAP transporter small permease [Nitratireductor mangrovi]
MSDQALKQIKVDAAQLPLLAPVARALSAVSNTALYLAGAGLVAMSVIVFWQVFLRYVLNWGNAWTELSANLIMSWFIFLGAAVGVRENFHLGFDVLLYVLPGGSKKVLRTLSDLVVCAFALGMIYYGITLMRLQWNEVMPGLGISGSFRYMPLTAGGVLIGLFALERIALRWSGVEVDRDIHDDAPAHDAAKEG